MRKAVSYRSSQLLNALIDQRKDFFTLNDAREILQAKDDASVRRLLSDMINRGLIMRIKEGLYHRLPYEQDPDQYFPNWHLTAAAIVHPRTYYIGFYSALDIHGLITQPSLVEQVVTQVQMKPKVQYIRNIRFEFVTLNDKRFFGYKKHWINDFDKVNCSDLEKTFMDCLYKPAYSGGITEITKALYKSREKIRESKIIDYLRKYDTQVVYKRLGFMLEHLGLFPEVQDFILGKLTTSYATLDPNAPNSGSRSSKWKMIDNVNILAAMNSIKT